MLRTKKAWLTAPQRQAQLRTAGDRGKTAYFGYESVPAAEKSERVRRHFNTVARQYDFMNTLLSFGIHHLWKRAAVRMLALSLGEKVLDVCGGTGDLAILAAKAIGPAGRVIVYDINRAMIQSGVRKIVNSAIAPRLQYVQGDAEHLSFPDACFDAAMVGFGIRNVTDMVRGFNEMFRVLKPGGKMMCLEFSKPTAPLFRGLYDFYSFYIMPLMGQLLAGSRQAYTHLPESIRMFPLPHELTAILNRIGFAPVTSRKLTNGIAVVHLARR
ncbi:MAG: bifunctional demethylmenaquinone methyltransferase/2-methoxy-6-polyprenyl-1,4-benzoquinol methylase UbiE [Desulfobacterales bacterium]|nr:MAG: bifunctional demethylmenaquinone methyltransferase/2-methoxy-6-polyprenyl-1,4-benzoquinol methylase UbiE [Desulfobacterales bacterium]